MYSWNFPKLDKSKYTNLETTVCYKALCVTTVPGVVVIVTRFSGRNSSSFLSAYYIFCDNVRREQFYPLFVSLLPHNILLIFQAYWYDLLYFFRFQEIDGNLILVFHKLSTYSQRLSNKLYFLNVRKET